MKYLRQWLEHRQRSVFSGFLSESQVKIMQKGLLQIIKANYDSVIIFQSNRATQISEWTTSGADRMRYSSIIGNGRQEGQGRIPRPKKRKAQRSEEHTSELQSRGHLVCRLMLEKNATLEEYNNATA